MFYLVHYDRAKSEVLSFKEFPDSQRQQALTKRFELEKNQDHFDSSKEIVLLQAANREELLKTHPKYGNPKTDGEKLFTAVAVAAVILALVRAS
ncbi:MAG: hypothetical protein WBK51_16985 [Polaromonas sp.]|jgi:hypothetical protein